MPEDGSAAPRGDAAEVRRRSVRGLDGLNFFVADMLTGFGPFVTVYLTASGWSPSDVGLALSLGTIAAVVGQVPAGALVDAVAQKRVIIGVGVVAVMLSALLLGTFPQRLPVFAAELLQGISASLLTPGIAAITITLTKGDKLGERLGGNVRFKALGSMVAALMMGWIGHRFGTGYVFYVAAVFGGVALGCLCLISGVDVASAPERTEHLTAYPRHRRPEQLRRQRELWRDPRLLVFAGCVFLFQLSNAALLPFGIAAIQRAGAHNTDSIVAYAIVISQAVTAVLSPWLGRVAHTRGRKPILLVGFAALALRGALFSIYSSEAALLSYQLLDGISASVIGVMVPLIVSDITYRGGRFNVAMGLVGLAMMGGAALSTYGAGYLTEHAGPSAAFLALSAVACAGCALVLVSMVETRQHATRAEPVPA